MSKSNEKYSSSCSPLPWHIEYGEAIKIKDVQGNTVAIMTHLHLRGKRSSDEVRANAELIVSSVNLKHDNN